MPSPTPTATLPPAPDAITMSSAAANASVASGAEFTIDFSVTASSLNYNGIQWELAYSPNISFVSSTYTCIGPNPPDIDFPSETETQPFEFSPDPGNPVANYKALGGGSNCASLSSSFVGQTQLGHFVSVTLQCDADGPTSVVLVGADRDAFYGTTLVARDTSFIPTGLRPHASPAFPAFSPRQQPSQRNAHCAISKVTLRNDRYCGPTPGFRQPFNRLHRHDSIEGFANFHEFQISGVVLMPATGKLLTVPGPLDRSQPGYRSRFDKSQLHLSGTKPCPY